MVEVGELSADLVGVRVLQLVEDGQERQGPRYIELPSGNGSLRQVYWTSPVSQPHWYAQLFEFHAA